MSDAKKQAYFAKLLQLLQEYPRALVVSVDNVGSHHMQKMRMSLRGEAVVLMGKNTMIRKALRSHVTKMPTLEALLPNIKGNVGFVFTRAELSDIKKKVGELRVEAPARVGAIAPIDVEVPEGPTGMEPTMTSFLQALNIGSKIEKGQVSITKAVKVITKGEKVSPGAATLLQKLAINPFTYGLEPTVVWDEGSVYPATLLDIDPESLVEGFVTAATSVAAISAELGLTNQLTVPLAVRAAYRNVLAVALETGVLFKRAEAFLAAVVVAFVVVAAAPVGKGADKAKAEPKAAAAPAKKEPEPEPAEEEDMGLGLFD